MHAAQGKSGKSLIDQYSTAAQSTLSQLHGPLHHSKVMTSLNTLAKSLIVAFCHTKWFR